MYFWFIWRLAQKEIKIHKWLVTTTSPSQENLDQVFNCSNNGNFHVSYDYQ